MISITPIPPRGASKHCFKLQRSFPLFGAIPLHKCSHSPISNHPVQQKEEDGRMREERILAWQSPSLLRVVRKSAT